MTLWTFTRCYDGDDGWTVPTEAWRTREEAVAAANAEHRHEWDDAEAVSQPYTPLEWEEGEDGEMYANEPDVAEWSVYRIEVK